MSRVFVNGPEDQGSMPGRVIPKTQKMLLDAALLSTQHYEIRIKGKVEQTREWSSAFPYISVWLLLKREPFGHSRLRSPTVCVCVCVTELNKSDRAYVEKGKRTKDINLV